MPRVEAFLLLAALVASSLSAFVDRTYRVYSENPVVTIDESSELDFQKTIENFLKLGAPRKGIPRERRELDAEVELSVDASRTKDEAPASNAKAESEAQDSTGSDTSVNANLAVSADGKSKVSDTDGTDNNEETLGSDLGEGGGQVNGTGRCWRPLGFGFGGFGGFPVNAGVGAVGGFPAGVGFRFRGRPMFG